MKLTISHSKACEMIRKQLGIVEDIEIVISRKNNPVLTPQLRSFVSEISSFMARGEKIPAIKRYREFTGFGLAESKVSVADYWADVTLPFILKNGRVPKVTFPGPGVIDPKFN